MTQNLLPMIGVEMDMMNNFKRKLDRHWRIRNLQRYEGRAGEWDWIALDRWHGLNGPNGLLCAIMTSCNPTL